MIRHDLQKSLSLQEVTEWVMHEHTKKTNDVHSWLHQVMDGLTTEAGAVNGWFVKSGLLHTLPVHCHTHQAMIDQLSAKTTKIKQELEAKELEAKAKNEEKRNNKRKGKSTYADGVEIDKVEAIRMRKEKAQSERLGKQPMPEHYASPTISLLGPKTRK